MGIILGIIIFILMVVFAVLGYCITDKISNEDDYDFKKLEKAEQDKIRRKNKGYKFKSVVFWVLSGISLIAISLMISTDFLSLL